MTNTQHTQGPWDVTPNGSAIYDERGVIICHLKTEVDYLPEAQANARLIASAPALLEALQKIAGVTLWGESMPATALRQEYIDCGEYDVVDDLFNPSCDTETSMLRDAIEMARDALEKLKA